MKYLIINNPGPSAPEGLPRDLTSLQVYKNQLVSALGNGSLDGAWYLQNGGHAYIVNTDLSNNLEAALASNPLWAYSISQIVPVTNAVDFLTQQIQLAGG
jgi:hypothetical protein